MKKIIFLPLSFLLISFPVMASAFYFDAGLGIGGGWTSIDGRDFAKQYRDAGVDVSSIGVDLNLKAGFGPLGRIPLYIVGTFGRFSNRVYDQNNYFQFNSFIAGGGIVFYPFNKLQLAGDVGVSWGVNETDLGYTLNNTSGLGYAWDVSAAVDVGGPRHALLIGLKYTAAYNTLETSKAGINPSMLGVFVKYAYRNKVN